MRQLDLAHDGGSCSRIWRGNDGAQCNGDAPRHVRDEPARNEGDRGGGDADRGDGETGDRHPVALQVTQGEIVGGIEQDRRDKQRERELRIERPGRAHRQQRDGSAADREQRRVGQADAAGEHRQQCRAEHQADYPFEDVHPCLRAQGCTKRGTSGKSKAGGCHAATRGLWGWRPLDAEP